MVGRSLNIPQSQNHVLITYFLLCISPLHPYQTEQWQNSNFVHILVLVSFLYLGSVFQLLHSKNTLFLWHCYWCVIIGKTQEVCLSSGGRASGARYYTNTQLDNFHWFGWNRIIYFGENIYLWCTAATLCLTSGQTTLLVAKATANEC